MTRPVTNPDSSAPSAPGGLAASGGLSSASVEWGGGVRQRRVWCATTCIAARGRVHAVGGEPGRAADGDELHGHGRGRHLLLPGHRRGRGRQRRRRLERGERRRSATAGALGAGDADARSGRSGRRRSPGAAATDNVGGAALQRPPRHQRRLHAERRRTGSRSRPRPATPITTSARHLLLQGHRRGRGRQHRRRSRTRRRRR